MNALSPDMAWPSGAPVPYALCGLTSVFCLCRSEAVSGQDHGRAGVGQDPFRLPGHEQQLPRTPAQLPGQGCTVRSALPGPEHAAPEQLRGLLMMT